MRLRTGEIRLSATDLSNHLACRHLTVLDLEAVRGERPLPQMAAPDLLVIRELGLRHEQAYLDFLASQKLRVLNLSEIKEESRLLAETRKLMEEGVSVIAQGALAHGPWFGRPDVLRRVESGSGRWGWSYEVADTKLSRETKATTILQLSLYSELLAKVQGSDPQFMWVVTPASHFAGECYRVAEYAAYYRYVRERLLEARDGKEKGTYPEPVPHCAVCRWFRECDGRRRAEDHLSLVAGIRRQQRDQLSVWERDTVVALAEMPIPLREKPKYGSRAGYERVREQARVQVAGRAADHPVYEVLPVQEGMGFSRLPAPTPDDLFLDLEGDPFVGEKGQQYLFGFAGSGKNGEPVYEKRWAFNGAQEKKGFEWAVDLIMKRWRKTPAMHVYHFGAYEPGAFKRLMGTYATREDEIDAMLRAGLFVDLHQVFKQGVRAGVEEYSLKKLEAFYKFERQTALDDSRRAMRYVEHQLELGWTDETLPEAIREAMEGYNSEDCFSTLVLRDWLEAEREKLVAGGASLARPEEKDGAPSEELDERQKRVQALVEKLTDGLPATREERSSEEQARWLVAQLLDWHRRENKATWSESYRLADLDNDELVEERAGLGGLVFLERLGVERKIPMDRYSYERQETEARREKDLYSKGEKFGTVVEMDPVARTLVIKKTRKTAELHPACLYVWDRPYEVKEQAEALFRLGTAVAQEGIDGPGRYRAARDLLLGRPPRLFGDPSLKPLAGEEPGATASRIAAALDRSVFSIQGPPGAGKTFTGARMICRLVGEGKKIGITALSHKVIRKLLDEVVAAAREQGLSGVRCMQRCNEEEQSDSIAIVTHNDPALAALQSGAANVLGGTSWLWTPESFHEAVDVLFIDEAGQMALADVVGVSQAARNLVLIGDPQQLERPLKGSHPEGAEKSALEHLLGGRKTIRDDMGFLLPETWRLHPRICEFTSELFYEGRLGPRKDLANRVLEGHPVLSGAGLWFVPVAHEGNRNSSAEEVDVIARIVRSLLEPGVIWYRAKGDGRPLEPRDILVVAPYNAQVSDLLARLPGLPVGTVDKFQGQEAPVVLYSLTTSSPEDAPRGMEFLYSLNRLNVATSRAMTTVIVVGNPRLFEPECQTPRQMQLANALCSYRERAVAVEPASFPAEPELK